MATIKFVDIVESASGKLCSHGTTIFMHKKASGRNYTSRICKPNTNPPTADQMQLQQIFANTITKVNLVMQDQAQVQTYKEQWKKQSKYSTLRGYIFSQVYGQD